MFNFRLKNVLLLVLMFLYELSVNSQECREYFYKAESYQKKGQYKKAIEFYQRSQACGDAVFQTKSSAMIDELNVLIERIDSINRLTESNSTKEDFIIVPSFVYLPAGTEEQTVIVNASGEWGVKGRTGIINVSKKNDKTLLVSSVTPNSSVKPRKSSVTVECGEITRTIIFEQDGVPEILEYKSKYMNVPFQEGVYRVDLNTNTEWKVDYADWYKATPDKNDSTVMVIYVDRNTKNEDRHGTIIVRSETAPSLYDELEIHQYANESRIFSPVFNNIIQISCKGDSVIVPIISDNPSWTESDRPSWCKATKLNSDSLLIIISKNDNYESREGFVNIKSNDRVAGIWIKQEASEIPDFMKKNILSGRNVSLGISAGLVHPIIKTSAVGDYVGSVVNYSFGNTKEEASYSVSNGISLETFADIRLYKNFFLIAGIGYSQYSYQNRFISNDTRNIVVPSPDFYNRGTVYDNYTEDYSFHFLDIPLLVSLRFPITLKSHVQFNAGPVICYGISSEMSLTGSSDSENLKSYAIINHERTNQICDDLIPYPYHIKTNGQVDLYSNQVKCSDSYVENDFKIDKSQSIDAPPFNRFNYGIRMGFAYEYYGIKLSIEYSRMLSNMANKKYWENERWMIFDQSSADCIMQGYKQYNNNLLIKVGYTFRNKKQEK